MLHLHLLRHSNADDLPPEGESGDAARRLTGEGIKKATVIGKAIRRLGLEFDEILSSPAMRTRQTAELVMAELETKPGIRFDEDLWIGGDSLAVVRKALAGSKPPASLLIIGHEPELGRLASRLLTGGNGLAIVFKKGGLCRLTIPRLQKGPCASLEWHLTPRQLRLMA